jgi:(+)-trans-carveol dehydrogenase
MGRLEGKVALITGGARGQGRAHAVRLAEEGADVVVCDIAEQLDGVPYPMATEQDLKETATLVKDLGRDCLAMKADTRDTESMESLVTQAVERFGKVDCAIINHGIAGFGSWDVSDADFDLVIDVNLRGVFVSLRAVARHLVERGEGGSLVVTSSPAGVQPTYNQVNYTTAKAGALMLAKSFAVELAPHRIRVNALLPALIDTPMIMNDMVMSAFVGKETGATKEDIVDVAKTLHLLEIPWIDPVEMAHAAVYLVSDESRFVTGTSLAVDGGILNQPAGMPWVTWPKG